MSLFDYLKCEYPINHPDTQDLLFQTKSLDSYMNTIRIDKDGMLWGQEYDIEDQSDPNAVDCIAGSMTRVNIREVPMSDFTGEIEFYTDYGRQKNSGFGEGFVNFSSYFINGRLQSITLIEDTVPDYLAAEKVAKSINEATPDVSGHRSRRI